MHKKQAFFVTTLVFAITLALAVPAAMTGAKPKLDRLEGWVQMIDTDQRKISLRQSPDVPRHVFFDNETKYTFRNEPASFDEVKVGRRVICLGTFDSQGRLQAQRVDVRTEE